MYEEKVIKIQKIEQCIVCNWNKFFIEGEFYRCRCTNPGARRKNGSCRIVNRKLLMRGLFPGWCPLENYKEKGMEELNKKEIVHKWWKSLTDMRQYEIMISWYPTEVKEDTDIDKMFGDMPFENQYEIYRKEKG